MGRQTPYFLFMSEIRDATKAELLAAGEPVTIGSVGKRIGAKWKELSDEEKQVFKERTDKHNAEEKERAAAAAAEAGEDGEPAQEEAEDKGPVLPFPISVLKRIVTEDQEVKRISGDGIKAVALATEIFLGALAERAGREAQSRKRKTVRYEDVFESTRKRECLRFLQEVLEDCRPLAKENAGNSRANKGSAAAATEAEEGGTQAADPDETQVEGEEGHVRAGKVVDEEPVEPDSSRRITDFFTR